MCRATRVWRWSAIWRKTAHSRWSERYFGPIAGGRKASVPVGARPAARRDDSDRAQRSGRAGSSLPDVADRSGISMTTMPALLLLGDILGRGRSSRLYRKLGAGRADCSRSHRLSGWPRASWRRSESSSRCGRRDRSRRRCDGLIWKSPQVYRERPCRSRSSGG